MERPQILIDSNIIISALVFNGVCRKIIVELRNRHYAIFVSQYIDHELRDKIIEKWEKKSEKILLMYEELHIPVLESSGRIVVRVRDPKDTPILNDAIDNDMDILFTGDEDFKNISCDVKIMNIKDMLIMLDM